MKAIMVMYDSLNRNALPPYGNDWIHAPNFSRLAAKTATFDTSYVCSMPCMPARRDFHTGRPNFLHRRWGPLEPFDDSVPEILKANGTYTHLITDHYHYFEDGGLNYHARYSSWENFRGQEGDPWTGLVGDVDQPCPAIGVHAHNSGVVARDRKNRTAMPEEADHYQSKTFQAGLDFINRNKGEDNWFLQIETFDPHEPFFSHPDYKRPYSEHYDNYDGPHFDWPRYDVVSETPEQVEHAQFEYASLVSMCDAKLGLVLDAMDAFDLWKDTMLIVWTDHGYLLGEHGCWAKSWTPFYEEIARTPFFVWDPRSRIAGERRQALVQPAIDLGPTLLSYFGMEPTEDMLGKDLASTIASDAPAREFALFGSHGHHVNVTDGQYVYMRAEAHADNEPLYNYTLIPTARNRRSTVDEAQAIGELSEPFSFSKGCRMLKIPAHLGELIGRGGGAQEDQALPTLLWDVACDPEQKRALQDPVAESRMIQGLTRLMEQCDAPSEQFERLGLAPDRQTSGIKQPSSVS